MIIIPAIDLIDGKCVRLTEGDYSQKKIYSDNPVETALYFEDIGAKRIHIIDLDGARTGDSINRDMIKKIKKETNLIVETGGGIRTEDDVKSLISGDIDHIILGTILVEDLPLVEKWIKEYGNKFIAGIDVRDNKVYTKGWTKDEGINAIEFGNKLKSKGFTTSIFTDISKDGRLEGPNIEGTKEFMNNTGLEVILSGGVSSINNIEEASKLESKGMIGVIIGKAFYEGKIDLKDVINKYQD